MMRVLHSLGDKISQKRREVQPPSDILLRMELGASAYSKDFIRYNRGRSNVAEAPDSADAITESMVSPISGNQVIEEMLLTPSSGGICVDCQGLLWSCVGSVQDENSLTNSGQQLMPFCHQDHRKVNCPEHKLDLKVQVGPENPTFKWEENTRKCYCHAQYDDYEKDQSRETFSFAAKPFKMESYEQAEYWTLEVKHTWHIRCKQRS